MSRFAPTLRLDVASEEIAIMEENGITLDSVAQESREFFQKVDMNKKPTFNAEKITDIETGIILHDYQTTVVGRFTIDGDLFLKTATGDIIKVEFNII